MIDYKSDFLKCLILTLIFVTSGFYLNVYTIIIVFVILLFLNFFYYYQDMDINRYRESKTDELDNFLKKLGDNNFQIYITESKSGAGIFRLLKPNIYLIPENTQPKKFTDESKAVVAHEYSHIKNMDIVRISLINYALSLCLSILILYISNLILIFFMSLLILLMSPIILNYFRHRSEYRADVFASKKVNYRAVQNRLRRNSHLDKDNRIPYTKTHPDVSSRISKLTRNNKR